MQFCKGIQVAALLAALSTTGLAAPVADANSIVARDYSYDSGSSYGTPIKAYHYNNKCDDDHTIGASAIWKKFTYHGHTFGVVVYKGIIFTTDGDKWYQYDDDRKTFSLCKEDEWDFRAISIKKDFGLFRTSYFDIDSYSDSDDDGYNSHDDDYGHGSDSDDEDYYADNFSYFSNKFNWNRWGTKYSKFRTFAVQWKKIRIGGHYVDYYTDGGRDIIWVQHPKGFLPFYRDGPQWVFYSGYLRRPSNWCSNFGKFDYFKGGVNSYGKRDYESDNAYGKNDSDSDDDYSDNEYGHGGFEIATYFKKLRYNSAMHAISFYYNGVELFISRNGFFTYRNGQCVPYTGIKFDASYLKHSLFVDFFKLHSSAYLDNSKWIIVKPSGYDTDNGYGAKDDSDCDSDNDHSGYHSDDSY